jgi:hypothetical protein
VLQVDGQKVAIEVDGSHHYTNSAPHVPLSEVVVRRRMLQDRGWKVVNVGYKEWEALPDDVSTRAAALLQLLSAAVGPLDSWQCVGAPTRSPGSLVANAEAAQAAAAAEQRQQYLHQQRDMMVNAWRAAGGAGSSVASSGSNMMMFGATTPGTGCGAMGQQGNWAAGPASSTDLGANYNPWGPSTDAGLGVVNMPGGLGMWGSSAFDCGAPASAEPSLLLQLRQLQQQLQQQQAWDAFMAADAARTSEDGAGDPLLAAGDHVASLESGAAASSVADGVGSVPPSPASGAQEGSLAGDAAAAAGALPAAEDLAVALAAAQQRWSNSPSSTQGSGGSSASSSNKKPAAFMWGDPTSASIWAP